jgi:hypothetical protein
MSTRENHAGTGVTAPPASRGRSLERAVSTLLVCPAEVALLRVNSKSGAAGNELILRSGIILQLTYREADALREDLLRFEERAESASAGNERHLRKTLLDVDL